MSTRRTQKKVKRLVELPGSTRDLTGDEIRAIVDESGSRFFTEGEPGQHMTPLDGCWTKADTLLALLLSVNGFYHVVNFAPSHLGFWPHREYIYQGEDVAEAHRAFEEASAALGGKDA